MRRPITMDIVSLQRWTDLWLNRGVRGSGPAWLDRRETEARARRARLEMRDEDFKGARYGND